MMKKIFPYIAIIVSMLIWAGSGIAVKTALEVLHPMQLVVIRFAIAVSLMLAIGLIGRKWIPEFALQKIDRKDWWIFALSGFFEPFLYFIFETYTYRNFATPTIAEAFLSTSPLTVPIFAAILLKDRLNRNNIIGILISTCGMILVVLAGSATFSIGSTWAIPLALITVMAASGYVILLKVFPIKYNALSITFWGQLVALCLFIPLWAITDGEIPHIEWKTTASHQMVVCLAYLSILSCVVAFMCYCYGLRKIGVSQGNAFNNIRPAFTAIIMWLLFDEHLPIWKLAGMVIVILGLFICQKKNIQ